MVAVGVSLVGTSYPQAVQIVLSGLLIGDDYLVSGSWAGGTWLVRGGTGVASGTQVVLADAAAPINVPVTYDVASDSGAASSSSITVPYADGDDSKYLLQSLDGRTAAAFRWVDNGAPRAAELRVALFRIPGRSRPVPVYDTWSGEEGTLEIRTPTVALTTGLQALLSAGGPVLLRTDGGVRDLPATDYLIVTSAQNRLTGAGPERNERVWSLTYQLVDDPDPEARIATSTWNDFDAVHAGLTWDDFDAEWAGQTWNQFDAEDWAIRAAP